MLQAKELPGLGVIPILLFKSRWEWLNLDKFYLNDKGTYHVGIRLTASVITWSYKAIFKGAIQL